MRSAFAVFLSLCLWLFIAAGVLSFVDDSIALAAGSTLLFLLSALVTMASVMMALLLYVLMGITPLVPKRLALSIALFYGGTILATLPWAIYWPHRIKEADWLFSLVQVVLGLGLAAWLGGIKPRWRLVDENQLGERWFSFGRSLGFLAANLFVVAPLVAAYLVVCLGLAISHYSDGFLTLRPAGIRVQARTYVRADGKSIELIPMIHVGDAGFYTTVSRSFPTNSMILMEGVTDQRHLLTNELSYKRMAKSLGLSEQKEDFAPANGEMIFADVDVGQFTTNTIGFLNLVMLVHSQGVNLRTVDAFLHYTPPPHFEVELLGDLIHKRNEHVLGEMNSRLPQSDCLILPWGVAHMPGLARQIQKKGFRLESSRDYTVIHFFPAPKS